MKNISFGGVEVGAEIHEEENVTEATVKYYVEKGEKRVYVRREDAMILLGIDQVAWMHTLNETIGKLERD